ncbi:hypothetical protein C8R46DRAFT_285322 [Mycena filopes]|nr:hypothetical protein C8R46DRAFT_285322 [Mycena filopes]
MAELPIELFELIAKENEDDPSIFILRLVSKTVNAVVTPVAFRVLVVKDNVKSASAVTSLQDCDESVTSHVRKVTFNGRTPEGFRSGEDAKNALKSAFAGLSKFPNLQTIQLDFHGLWEEFVKQKWTRLVPDELSRFYNLQCAILAGLAENPIPSLVSLVLHNVIALPNAIYQQENFHRLLQPLQTLEITSLSDPDTEVWFEKRFLSVFWRQSVAHMVHAASSLTSLIIRSDQDVGVNPPLSFMNAVLPNLTSLVLEQFMLDPTVAVGSGVFAFILRHQATLTHLELHYCAIDGGEGPTFPGQWATILTRFERDLGALREFVFDNHWKGKPTVVGRDTRFTYTRLNREQYDYQIWKEVIEGEEQDLPALESLLAVVKSRRAGDQ